MTQSFENGRVDSTCFFTELTQSLTLPLMAGITTFINILINQEKIETFSLFMIKIPFTFK